MLADMDYCEEQPSLRQGLSRRERRRRTRRRQQQHWVALTLALLLLLGGLGFWLWRITRPLPGETVVLPDYVTADLLPMNRWSRPGIALEEINGIVLHYVGNPGTTAQANRNYFASLASGESDTFASSHFIVGLDGEVIQCIPLTEIAYASNDRNGDTIAIEVCHPDETGQYSPETYQQVVELTVFLCRELKLDPETQVIRHYDVTGKICPKYYVENPEAWATLQADITAQAALSG
jgi:N-acetylmuramoyl-L-alanine amidase